MVSVEDLAQSCICVFISLFLSFFSLSLSSFHRILLCSPGWLTTHDLPASVFHVLGLQECTTMPIPFLSF
jgi:hypothetical protein